MERVKANDPVALNQVGAKCYNKGDSEGAIEYWTKAVILGDVEAHHQLSVMYRKGLGVEKDEERELYHTEQAAIGGHPDARHNLALLERRNGRVDRAVKHFIIAAQSSHTVVACP